MQTDTERWKNLKVNWDERTTILSRMIPQEAQTVIEFGAGKGSLKGMLHPHQHYTPCDLVSRGPDTIVFDLNESPYPKLQPHDVVVLSGVLEYMFNLPSVIEFICSITDRVICSYADSDTGLVKKNSWCNNYTQKQFQHFFSNNGFYPTEIDRWKKQSLYNFKRI